MNDVYPKLFQWEKRLETPLLWLSFVWLIFLVLELVHGVTPELWVAGTFMWAVFLVDFLVLKLWTAPSKTDFLKENWLMTFALLLPVLRFFPFLQHFSWIRALSATSALQLVWFFFSVNAGMRALRTTMKKHGFGYALALTSMVLLVGAAGMYHFENPIPAAQGLHNYLEAIWWTAMIMTTIGSGYSPMTPGGQVICLAIALFGCGMFGYLTASLATFFIGRDTAQNRGQNSGVDSMAEIRARLETLSEQIKALEDQHRH